MNGKNYLVSPKQIAAFELYDRIGSEFLSVSVHIKNKDRKRIQNTWNLLIRQREILRAIFIYEDAYLYRREIPSDPDLFPLPFIIVDSQAEYEHQNASSKSTLGQLPLHNNRLFYGVVYEFPLHQIIVFYINHIISNTAALSILKENFITLYKDHQAIVQNYSFDNYIQYQVTNSRKRFLSEYSFHEQKLNGIIPDLIRPDTLQVDLTDNQSFIRSITTKTFEHRKNFNLHPQKPAEVSEFYYLIAYFNIPDYAGFKLRKYSLYTIIVAAYLKAMTELSPETFYFQFLMDYRNNKYSLRQIGDFSADFYLAKLTSSCSGSLSLASVHSELFKTYKSHAIYNYQMFNIDVGKLFSNCNILLNYTPVNGTFNNDESTETGEISFNYGRAHKANFEISVDSNGLMHYRLLAKIGLHSKHFLSDFNRSWQQHMKYFLSLKE